jgi:hypothetical protein
VGTDVAQLGFKGGDLVAFNGTALMLAFHEDDNRGSGEDSKLPGCESDWIRGIQGEPGFRCI